MRPWNAKNNGRIETDLMRLRKIQKDQFVFQLGRRERRMLLEILKLYPMIPAAYQPLSKSADPDRFAADQKLLEEALAEQRQKNKRELDSFLTDPKRFQENRTGFSFSLNPHQIEWLLQILNDLRVGSWLRLGCPGPQSRPSAELNATTALHLWTMELCGHFQAALVEAFDRNPENE